MSKLSKFFRTSQEQLLRTIKIADELVKITRQSRNTQKLEFEFSRCVDDDERAMYSFAYGLCISKLIQEGDGVLAFIDMVGAHRDTIVEFEELFTQLHGKNTVVAMEHIRSQYEEGTINQKMYFILMHSIGFISHYVEDLELTQKPKLSAEEIQQIRDSNTLTILKQRLFEGWSESIDDYITGVKFGYEMGVSLNFAIAGVLNRIIEVTEDVFTGTEEIVKTFTYVTAKAIQAEINVNEQIADCIFVGAVLQLPTLKTLELLELCAHVNAMTDEKVLTHLEGLAYLVNLTQYTQKEILFAVYAYSRRRDYSL